MYRIIITDVALYELQTFIAMYEEGFFNLYIDSGLYNLDVILKNYEAMALQLNDKIFNSIPKVLETDKVLGRKNFGEWFEITFHIDNRLIVLYYTENVEEQIRWVERIIIDRKLIVF